MDIAVVQSVLQVFFDNSASYVIQKIGLALGADKELNTMSRTVVRIKAMLKDAEEREETNDESIKVWLSDLKAVAYDLEDMLEEFNYEALRLKLEEELEEDESQSGIWDQVSSFIPASIDFVSYKYVKMSKIKEMRERIEEIAKEGERFRLGELGGVRQHKKRELRETTSLIINKAKFFGRDDDKEGIIKLLIPSEPSEENVSVVPIVGMGGLGKTTLAQHVYNDNRVINHFQLRMWVYVSDDFNLKKLTKKILESAKGNSSYKNLDTLQNELVEKLNGKRFLLVLDDVWNEDPKQWDLLRAPFTVGAKGSKIIVTTHNENVSRIMSSLPPHIMKGLTEDAIWSLFVDRAFANRNSNKHPKGLVSIGKQIIKKCKGSPLVANLLGGLLHDKQEQYQWSEILQSKIFLEVKNDILPILKLCYQHLPPNLKRCFAYCSIFPKDYKFDKDDLVQKWIAEGFIEGIGTKPLEDIGSKYFDDLLSRSIFQLPASSDHSLNQYYNMHDLFHDLSVIISGNECLGIDGNRSPSSVYVKARHASFKNPVDLKVFNKSTSLSLRTLVLLCQRFKTPIGHVPDDFFTKLTYLRVLDLSNSGTTVTDLQNTIENLKHLRYLNLSYTEIERLPESITKLYNLQTLKLKNTRLVEFPKGIMKLINLRNLKLDRKIWSSSTPPGIGKLTNLQKLRTFVVDRESGCGIGELKDMKYLRSGLDILKLENVVNAEEATQAGLVNKERLETLRLEWSEPINSHDGVEEKVLEFLQPHTNLKGLEIRGYNGAKFPHWMESPLFCLVEVRLTSCKSCEVLPSLGQLPYLKDLFMEEMDSVRCMGRDFCGFGEKRFPSLEELRIENMNVLEVWSELAQGDYLKLSQLAIGECPKLRELPHLLPSLSTLYLEACNVMVFDSLSFYTSLSYLDISRFSELKSFPDFFLQPLTKLEKLSVWNCDELESLPNLQNLTFLQSLLIDMCPQLASFPEGLQNLTSLQILHISYCPQLTSFPEEGLQNLTSLQSLRIETCHKLVLLPKRMGDLSSLKKLYIGKCNELSSLPEGLQNLKSLQSLRIVACHKLMSLPQRMQDLPSLEELEICQCNGLLSLPNECLPLTLQSLNISYYPQLTSFPEDGLQKLSSLHTVIISQCHKLTSLPERMRDLPSLQKLHISELNELSSLPDECLPTTLLELNIGGCHNLNSLPKGLQNLTSLKTFSIHDCPQLESLPEDGLPTMLKELHISRCPQLQYRHKVSQGTLVFINGNLIDPIQR